MSYARLYISSDDRQINEDTNDFTVYLDNAIIDPKTVSVISVDMPNTVYPFKVSNSKFWYFVRPVGSVTPLPFSVDIPTNTNFETVQDFLNAVNPGFLNNGHNFLFTYSSATGKLSWGGIPPTNNEYKPMGLFDVSNPSYFNSAQNKLGYLANEYTYNNIATPFEADGCFNMLATNAYYFECNLSLTESLTTSLTQSPNIMFKIPNDKNFGGILHYQSKSDEHIIELYKDYINKINFRVLDDEYEVVNLNGGSVSIELHFTF